MLKEMYIKENNLFYETEKYGDFILKCKESLCTDVQLEIMEQTKGPLLKYKKALENSNHLLTKDIEEYIHCARCTFLDFGYTCNCKFFEGKRMLRKI